MDKILIKIDYRERKLFPFLDDGLEYKYEIATLDAGDIQVMYDGNLFLLIERKSMKDLRATLIDEERKANVQKLIAKRAAMPGLIVMYIVESGDIASKKNTPLESHLDHLLFRDNISTAFTKSKAATVAKINRLVKNYVSLNLPKPTGGNVAIKIAKTPELQRYKMFRNCGISNSISQQLSEVTCIRDIILKKFTLEDVAKLTFPSGNILGSARGEKILKKCKDYRALLAAMPGFSETKADAILAVYGFKKIMRAEVTLREISDVKVGSRRLGIVCATTLFNLLQIEK